MKSRPDDRQCQEILSNFRHAQQVHVPKFGPKVPILGAIETIPARSDIAIGTPVVNKSN